jgi:3-hydroxyacyl-[acyl-carrier-protein] dehydratase
MLGDIGEMMKNIDPVILKELHHRPPHLYVQRLGEHDQNHLMAECDIDPEFAFFQGHFPGAPIVPGSVMCEMTTQAAGLLIALHFHPDHREKKMALGVLRRYNQAKFLSFLKPLEEAVIKVQLVEKIDELYRFKGRVERKDKSLVMANEFTLTNLIDPWGGQWPTE